MDAIIEKLLQYPNLSVLLNELKQFITEEDIQRQRYHKHIEQNGKAEFINGETIIYARKNYRSTSIIERLFHFLSSSVIVSDEGIALREIPICLSRNNYQPDIVFYKKEKIKAFKDDQIFLPAPDFIVEFSSSVIDKSIQKIKFEDYALHNVKEYWLLNLTDDSAEQYLLQNGKYELEHKGKTGTIVCEVLLGFAVEVEAIFKEEKGRKALQQILTS